MTSTELITRGTIRLLHSMGYAALSEMPLSNGRRADLVGLGKAGHVVIVEVKSCISDYRADCKWHEYLPFCDEFFFAVDADFPIEIFSEAACLPSVTGVIVADEYGGEVIRNASARKLNAARRKNIHLKMARAGAARLSRPFIAEQGSQSLF